MASNAMKAQKVKKEYNDYTISRESVRKIKKHSKKLKISLILVAVFMAIGAVGGFFAHKYAFANDVYAMVAFDDGLVDVVIGENEDANAQKYVEKGVKCVAFGKDYSKDCTVKYFYLNEESAEIVEVKEIDETQEGYYYAEYTCTAIKYKTVKLIRNIRVLGGEN